MSGARRKAPKSNNKELPERQKLVLKKWVKHASYKMLYLLGCQHFELDKFWHVSTENKATCIKINFHTNR